MDSEIRQMMASWFRYLGPAVLAYGAALGGCVWALGHLPAGAARTGIVLLPVLPGLYLVGTTARLYGRCDEYVRRRILEAVAWSASVTAVWTMVYAFLELAGLPRLSVAWVVVVGWAVFVGLMLRFIATHR